MMISQPICVAPTQDHVGEGVLWHAGHDAVYWTDINRFLIHRFTPADQGIVTWCFDEPVTALILTDQDEVLTVALGSRVIFWEPASDLRRDQGFCLDGWPHVRLNDARADPRGSLWAGSMRNNIKLRGSPGEAGGTDGVLHRIDPDGTVTVHRRGIGIANTIAWSPNGRHFYFGDSLADIIWVYDVDPVSGAIYNERPFLKEFHRGIPDGSAVDADGYLWNCRFYGGCIVRVAPDGRIDRVIDMPVRNITTCTFGGPDLKTLYITTASVESSPTDLSPGGLFAIQSSVPGLSENRFRGSSAGITSVEVNPENPREIP